MKVLAILNCMFWWMLGIVYAVMFVSSLFRDKDYHYFIVAMLSFIIAVHFCKEAAE